ncbi:YhfC family intramembrane metalloprotease [Facklamia sp. DSM 111018]|uniref:YhfC family intramembrane metalloprotease n=1 Tax=Facklamia lactis TaxID=2749967 RepID=A0ABS0LRC1_9LACT|nr:YhfC family glutamic-type intramembrane protease [Facklamia lactis]MBG9980938.1 YhfC family intramembrane metalloprotease [Facklamia lactis]MBG9986699.1 YhfC family intramembrane metalloprotease [Facklamia lactis]
MAYSITLVICIGIPIVGLFLSMKYQMSKIFLFGVLSFLVSQLLIRLPLIRFIIANSDSIKHWVENNRLSYLFVLSFTAGLFEETSRWIFLKRTNKQSILKTGFLFGLGHGGIEALILAGLPSIISSNQLLEYGLISWERLVAIGLHIALSMIVYYGVLNKEKRFWLITIGLHCVANFITVIVATRGYYVWAEIIFTCVTLLVGIYATYLIRKGRKIYE